MMGLGEPMRIPLSLLLGLMGTSEAKLEPAEICDSCHGIGLVNHPDTGAIEPCTCFEGQRQRAQAERDAHE